MATTQAKGTTEIISEEAYMKNCIDRGVYGAEYPQYTMINRQDSLIKFVTVTPLAACECGGEGEARHAERDKCT